MRPKSVLGHHLRRGRSSSFNVISISSVSPLIAHSLGSVVGLLVILVEPSQTGGDRGTSLYSLRRPCRPRVSVRVPKSGAICIFPILQLVILGSGQVLLALLA